MDVSFKGPPFNPLPHLIDATSLHLSILYVLRHLCGLGSSMDYQLSFHFSSHLPCMTGVPSGEGKPECVGVRISNSLFCKVILGFSSPPRWFPAWMDLDRALHPLQKPPYFRPRGLPSEAPCLGTAGRANNRFSLKIQPKWKSESRLGLEASTLDTGWNYSLKISVMGNM